MKVVSEEKKDELEIALSEFYERSNDESKGKWAVTAPGLEEMIPIMREVLSKEKADIIISMMKNLEVAKVTLLQSAVVGVLGVTPDMMREHGGILTMIAGDTRAFAEAMIEFADEKTEELKSKAPPDEVVH